MQSHCSKQIWSHKFKVPTWRASVNCGLENAPACALTLLISRLGSPAYSHPSLAHFLIGLLQYDLHGTAVDDQLEATDDSECSGSRYCSYGHPSICPCNISTLQTALVTSEFPDTVQTSVSFLQSPLSCRAGLLAELSYLQLFLSNNIWAYSKFNWASNVIWWDQRDLPSRSLIHSRVGDLRYDGPDLAGLSKNIKDPQGLCWCVCVCGMIL